MAVKKMPISLFVEQLAAALNRKDGYIMGATGQDPKKWSTNSWWFTQYDDNSSQKAKALYWRNHAARVWDCNGLAEGLYKDYSGTDINTKARYNYQNWCDPKGTGMIPESHRVSGAAVFWGDSGKPGTIHHVAYLWKPVKADDPKGDWYLIEARGVMYGVVQTKLLSRKPNFWGLMSKYFDYNATAVVEPVEEKPVESGNYISVTHGNYYVRQKPDKNSASFALVHDEEKVVYLGKEENGWYNVSVNGKSGWLSSKAGSIVTASNTELTVKTGSWNVRTEPNSKAKILGVVKAGDKLISDGTIQNGWYSVIYKNQFAWISTKGIK